GIRRVEGGGDGELRPRTAAEQQRGRQKHEQRHLLHQEVSPGEVIGPYRYSRTRPVTGSATHTRPLHTQFIWYVTRNPSCERSRKYPVGKANAPPSMMYWKSNRSESLYRYTTSKGNA